MLRFRLLLLAGITAVVTVGHPMGNFSISHYARIDLTGNETDLKYVLDFAEIPTFELLQRWRVDGKDPGLIRRKARDEATTWLANLSILQQSAAVRPVLRTVDVVLQDGAGGMPVLRVTILATLAVQPGRFAYADHNYPDRTGWKQIVIRPSAGSKVLESSQNGEDVTNGLTRYPADSTIAPPQDLEASANWVPVTRTPQEEPVVRAVPQSTPPSVPVATNAAAQPIQTPAFASQQPVAAGMVVKGDYLSQLLKNHEISLTMILIGFAAAFGLGAIHALSPGHGKTIVAAYLVGNRGTAAHALLLGAIVTFTHTASVFLLGLGVLFLQQYIVPDRIIPWLGAASGLSIVSVGCWLLYQRTKALLPAPAHTHQHSHDHHSHDHEQEQAHEHSHHHDHEHQYAHAHSHDHHEHKHSHAHADDHHHHNHGTQEHVHPHTHDHADFHVHSHGGKLHSHVPPEKITMGTLIALGISGGLVPCPSALVVMLSAIALGHAALGLLLLVGFSLGLALVLMSIGLLVIYAKNLLPERARASHHPFFRLVPVFSSVIVVCLGLAMTAVALGWIRPGKFSI